MNKIALILAFLYVLTGCASSNEVQPAENPGSQQNAEAANASSFAVAYEPVDALELKQAEPSLVGELVEIKKLDNAEIAVYRRADDENRLAATLQVGSTRYDLGEIGYGPMKEFPVETVEVLGVTYLKLVGANGANSPITDYILPNSSGPSLLRIDAHTVEADVDEDGVKEIVASVGTAAETTLYKLQDQRIAASNLNELLKAQVVLYDFAGNTFQAQNTGNEMTKWELRGNEMRRVP